MRTCDLLKLLLKATAAGLVTTSAVIGAEGLVMSTANAFSSIPADGDQCLDKLEHQRQVGNLTTLWSLLAFVPGFVLGTLYFLSKQVNLCNPSASQYETIDDDEQDSVTAFCNSLVDAEDPLLRGAKIFLTALLVGTTALGLIYGPVRLAVNDLDRNVFTPEKCHSDMRDQTIFDLIECTMIFGIAFGAVLCAGCSKSPRRAAQITPAQLESGRAADSARALTSAPVTASASVTTSASAPVTASASAPITASAPLPTPYVKENGESIFNL